MICDTNYHDWFYIMTCKLFHYTIMIIWLTWFFFLRFQAAQPIQCFRMKTLSHTNLPRIPHDIVQTLQIRRQGENWWCVLTEWSPSSSSSSSSSHQPRYLYNIKAWKCVQTGSHTRFGFRKCGIFLPDRVNPFFHASSCVFLSHKHYHFVLAGKRRPFDGRFQNDLNVFFLYQIALFITEGHAKRLWYCCGLTV